MNSTINIFVLTFKSFLRDKILHAILAAVSVLFLLVPALSIFSMRQVQELAITLSLSLSSFVLLILATILGASSIWRDLERRYALSILGLPISRTSYVLGKFLGIAAFIAVCALLLSIAACLVIAVSAGLYPADQPIHWMYIFIAITGTALKYILLSAVAMVLSTLSTSFFLPFFGTISLYLAGSASQGVYEYLSGAYGRQLAPPLLALIKGVYYLVPNFSAFDLNVNAIYGLPVSWPGLVYTVAYFTAYLAILLCLAAWSFARRELS
jgi:ABC-type transport system involved in multi-copper enzyme maturation permease subunit